MARPRKTPLPRGIYERKLADGSVAYSISFQDGEGKQRQERVGTSLDAAKRLRAERIEQVAAGTYTPGDGAPSMPTIAQYVPTYTAVLRGEKRRTVGDVEQRLRDHVVPALGHHRLDELRPKDVAAWVTSMRANGALSPKTVRNIHGALSAMLALAVFEEIIDTNPAKGLRIGTLPKIQRRKVPAWTREEIATWIWDARIPEDRRVAYAICSFTGTRLGEAAGMRLRDLDRAARPLWLWDLKTQYDGEPLKGDDGGNPRSIPIHRELQRIIEAWLAEGWVRWIGRQPTRDDFVVPREDGTVHSKQSLGSKAVVRHARLVGIEKGDRDFHSFRRSMITLTRTDGADGSVLERITHNAAGEQIDQYTLYGWEALCGAISALRLDPPSTVVSMPPSTNENAPVHDRSHDRGANEAVNTEESDGGAGSRSRRRPTISRHSGRLRRRRRSGAGGRARKSPRLRVELPATLPAGHAARGDVQTMDALERWRLAEGGDA